MEVSGFTFSTADFGLKLLFSFSVFSALYIINTVYKEQTYEALAYALTSVVIIIYVTINYIHNGNDPDRYLFQVVS